MYEGSLFSKPSPALIICRLFNDGHSDQCDYLTVVLICTSLIISNDGHLFMCQLAICISFMKKYLFRSFFRSVIALQCCVSFCCAMKWTTPSLVSLSPACPAVCPPPTPARPTESSQSSRLSSLCCTVTSHQLLVLHGVVYMCQYCSPSSSHPPLIPMSTYLFSTSASLFLPCI